MKWNNEWKDFYNWCPFIPSFKGEHTHEKHPHQRVFVMEFFSFSSAARIVFIKRLATVRSPHSAGTGVIKFAFWATSSNGHLPPIFHQKTIHPYINARRLLLLSYHIGGDKLCFSNHNNENICSSCVFCEIFCFLKWHTVTVALRLVSITAMGFPTIFERPTTTTSFPAGSIWYSSKAE